MAGQRTTFGKLQRDRAKKAKAAAKRERRHERGSAEPDDAEATVAVDDGDSELSAPRLLELIELIHRQFDAKTISYEEFEEKKADLLARLPVD